jgi:hypothetical protein
MLARVLASVLVAILAVVGREFARTRAELVDARTDLDAERAYVRQLRNVTVLAPFARRATLPPLRVLVPRQTRREPHRASARRTVPRLP